MNSEVDVDGRLGGVFIYYLGTCGNIIEININYVVYWLAVWHSEPTKSGAVDHIYRRWRCRTASDRGEEFTGSMVSGV